MNKNNFVMYDGLLFDNKPDLGLKLIKNVAPESDFFIGDQPSESQTRNIAAGKPSSMDQDIYYLDIETLPDSQECSQLDLSETIVKLTSVAKWFKSERPNLTIGYYGVLPHRQYWKTGPEWLARNDYFIPLSSHVDYVAPSLYTFYADQPGWAEYAIKNIQEARKYGKPIFPFIWPQYHQSTELAGQLVPGDYWRLQLETLYDYADGVILWGGWNDDWNVLTSETDPANWWFQTLDFMNSKGLS